MAIIFTVTRAPTAILAPVSCTHSKLLLFWKPIISATIVPPSCACISHKVPIVAGNPLHSIIIPSKRDTRPDIDDMVRCRVAEIVDASFLLKAVMIMPHHLMASLCRPSGSQTHLHLPRWQVVQIPSRLFQRQSLYPEFPAEAEIKLALTFCCWRRKQHLFLSWLWFWRRLRFRCRCGFWFWCGLWYWRGLWFLSGLWCRCGL